MKRRTFLGLTSAAALDAPMRGLAGAREDQKTTMPSAPAQYPLGARVTPHNGRPTLFINDEPVYPMLYALTDCPGGRWSFDEVPRWNITRFTEQGVRLFQVDLFLEFFWPERGTASIDLARQQIRGVLDVCPDAAVFIRLHMNTPRWWNEQYREECTTFCDGPVDTYDVDHLQRIIANDLKRALRPSLASAKWRAAASEKTAWFCKELANTPEGGHVAGIQLACGIFGEWHYWGFLDHDPDSSVPMTQHFRHWLREKYSTDAALRAAWANPGVTLESAAVPGLDDRNRTTAGIFRDPQKERNVIDYFECQHNTVADDIIHFCRLTKESWPRPIVTGTFYGYFFVLFGREAAGGHLAVEKVLQSPYVDYLSAPGSYDRGTRAMGGGGHSRGLIESCNVHGKLWLDEMDERPEYNVNLDADARGSLSDSIAIIRRNVAQTYTRGQGLWFYDFGWNDTSGWWDAPELMAEIGKVHKVFTTRFKRPFRSGADVLLVYDTHCYYYLASKLHADPLGSSFATDQATLAAYHSSAALAMVHLSVLDKVDWKQYRAVVFGNTFFLTPTQRDFIRKTVAQSDRHLIWIGAPGYTDGSVLNQDFIGETTGIKVERARLSRPAAITVDAPDAAQAQWKAPAAIDPLFVVQDDAATALGHLDETHDVALARKAFEGGTSWFCTLPITNPEVLRYIFKTAGVRLYGNTGDVIHHGGDVLSVHTVTGGERNLPLNNGKVVKTVLEPRSTVYFDPETGKRLLG